MFGSTDLSGLISSAFKDITKIPYNSQLFDYWISEISGDIAAQPSPGFSWDSEMIVTFTDTLSPVGTVQLEIVEKMIDVTEPLSHNNTTSDLPLHSSKYNFYYLLQ